ncbi:MAG: hypothetical protein ACI92I_000437 [Acidimicrobiales bacterium]|jgi:hypothetical protein
MLKGKSMSITARVAAHHAVTKDPLGSLDKIFGVTPNSDTAEITKAFAKCYLETTGIPSYEPGVQVVADAVQSFKTRNMVPPFVLQYCSGKVACSS